MSAHEPCESCRMTVSTVRWVGDNGAMGRYMAEVAPSGDLHWPKHTPERCRAARTLRDAMEAVRGGTDRVQVVPGSAPGSRTDDNWLQLRAERQQADGRLCSIAQNVAVRLIRADTVTGLAQHFDFQLDAKAVTAS